MPNYQRGLPDHQRVAMCVLSLLLNKQYIGNKEPVHFDSFKKSYNNFSETTFSGITAYLRKVCSSTFAGVWKMLINTHLH